MARDYGPIYGWHRGDTIPTEAEGGYAGASSTASAVGMAQGQATQAVQTIDNLAATATTLPPGSPATATVTGPMGAKVVNFSIPRGEPGMGAEEGAILVAQNADTLTAAQQAQADADAAVTLAQQAQAAAYEVPDVAMSDIVNNPATQTRAALDGFVQPVIDQIDDTQQLTPTLEETAFSSTLPAVSATTEMPLYVAPYPSKLGRFALAFPDVVAASWANFWTVELYRRTAVGEQLIAARDTKDGVAAWSQFDFDSFDLAAGEFNPGDVLSVKFTKTGTPAALSPAVTFRAPVADVNPGPPPPPSGPIVIDSFTRADSTTSLGLANTGHAWTALEGVWGIASNAAYCAAPVASVHNYAVVDSGVSDCTIEATMPDVGPTGSNVGLAFRVTDKDNCFFISREGLFRRTTGTSTQIGVAWIGSPIQSGDRLRIVLNGPSIEAHRQAGGVGSFDLLASTTSTSFQANTRHGLRVYTTTGGAARFDDFQVIA